jgi:hypothetical protein
MTPEYWWVYPVLLSPMIPSLINLTIGGLALPIEEGVQRQNRLATTMRRHFIEGLHADHHDERETARRGQHIRGRRQGPNPTPGVSSRADPPPAPAFREVPASRFAFRNCLVLICDRRLLQSRLNSTVGAIGNCARRARVVVWHVSTTGTLHDHHSFSEGIRRPLQGYRSASGPLSSSRCRPLDPVGVDEGRRAVERLGVIISQPILGGLQHQYCRI